MKVLVVGGGGREHAIVRALARSPQHPQLLCAPGNAGIADDARLLDIAAEDVDGIVEAVQREDVELTVVGPEAPLVAGLVDRLAERGRAAFGPTAAAARLEGSKAFAKQAMERAGVPTAQWRRVESFEQGAEAVAELAAPGVVVKADGLAAGKGVTVADTEAEALAALESIFGQRGHAAARQSGTALQPGTARQPGTVQQPRTAQQPCAVIEERLTGAELSLLALCDGTIALPLAPARDYKRIFAGDRGPNTGGMGSFSPVPGFDAAQAAQIANEVHQPIVDLMRADGTPFHGVLYAGLMLTAEGVKVLEFNVRFGDPETQAVLPRLRSDLLELLLAASRLRGLHGADLRWESAAAVSIVLASAGYPASAATGKEISGIQAVPEGVEVTHAGTKREDGRLLTAGGRVLNVTALGANQHAARAAAYAAAAKISFAGMQLRADIAADAADADTTDATTR